jgi:hypothetical protein
MSLSMKSKTPVKFEFSDGVATTEVVLAPDDDQETLIAKLERVLSLARAHTAQRQGQIALLERELTLPLENSVAVTTDTIKPTTGWAAYGGPELPEHLKGDYEMEDGT